MIILSKKTHISKAINVFENIFLNFELKLINIT